MKRLSSRWTCCSAGLLCPLLLSAGLFAPAIAGDKPFPPNSTLPKGVTLVGTRDGVPDPLGATVFLIRSLLHPLPNVTVTLDFANCPDVRLGDMTAPDTWFNCGAKTISKLTDGTGTVTFIVVGSTDGASRPLSECVRVFADGVAFPALIASSYDLNAAGGVNGLDLSIAAGDVFSGQYRGRSDFDFDGDLDMIDVSQMARAMFAGGSATSAVTCP